MFVFCIVINFRIYLALLEFIWFYFLECMECVNTIVILLCVLDDKKMWWLIWFGVLLES